MISTNCSRSVPGETVMQCLRNCSTIFLDHNASFWSVRSKLNPQQSPAICSWTWMGVGCWYPCFRIAWKMTEKYKLFLTFIWCIGWPISFNNRTTVLLIFLCKVTTLRQVYLWSSVDHFHDISLTFHERSCLGKGTQDVRPPWSLDPEHEPCEQRKSREPGWRIQWHLGWRWKLRFQTQGPDNPWRHSKDQRTRRGSIMIPPLVTMWDWSANEIPLVDQIPHFQRSLQSITALGSRSDSQINSRFCDLTVSRNPTTSDHLPSSLLHTWILTL